MPIKLTSVRREHGPVLSKAKVKSSSTTPTADAMPTRFSRTRKHRGHVSAGHGRVGKHRKHPGGRGLAGGQHHHRTNLDKYHPGYFGKVGMRYFHKQQAHFWKPVINLDKLWTLVPAEKREEYLAGKGDKVPVIDLLPFGYSKLLGKGRLPEVPIVVKARWVSKLAEKKITEAGGVVELVA
ncbi:ribosomal protein L15 [Colletotrichum filicis]|nr:ribosomal protein L15 [Colletotrichum filicis]